MPDIVQFISQNISRCNITDYFFIFIFTYLIAEYQHMSNLCVVFPLIDSIKPFRKLNRLQVSIVRII